MMTNDATKVMTLGGLTSGLGKLSSTVGALPFTHAFTPLYGVGNTDITAISGLGEADDSKDMLLVYAGALSTIGGILSGVHGYKRTGGNLPWTAAWTALGLLFPVPTTFYAFGQGYAVRKRGR